MNKRTTAYIAREDKTQRTFMIRNSFLYALGNICVCMFTEEIVAFTVYFLKYRVVNMSKGKKFSKIQTKERTYRACFYCHHFSPFSECCESCTFWSAAIHCRFDKFWSAVRLRTALKYFGMRYVSYRFRLRHASWCFRFAVRPCTLRDILDCGESLAALDYGPSRTVFISQHVSCRFRTAQRLAPL